jgi:hypothetical protein
LATKKSYVITQSPFFKLKTKRKFASIFGLELKNIYSLLNRKDNYFIFLIEKNSPKERQVEVPKPLLERVHRRIFALLSNIKPPDFLHSGVKGRSYITNAQAHMGASRLLKLDIAKFYPSTKKWHVFDFFKNVMLCSEDVAGILASLITVDDHVPTGSCLSQLVAFYAHHAMWLSIDALAVQNDLKMTCYVDDITISGGRVSGKLLYEVKGLLAKRGLKSKRKKEKVYYENEKKMVTGVVVDGYELKLRNKRHKNIYDCFLKYNSTDDAEIKQKIYKKLIGQLSAASVIDSGFRPKLEAMMI